MPFSLTSYLLGVGTVVGALAFGFGGGVLLTNAAMKETAAGPTRVERVARSEPEVASAPQLTSAKDVSTASSALPLERPAAHSDAVPAAHAEALEPDVRRETEPAKQTDQATATEQTKAEQQKSAERKVERQKRYAERKAREITAARMRPRRSEVQDLTERPELTLDQPRFDRFRMPSPLPLGNSDNRDDD
jgi:type IV secretory pathway VirB10-like protein